MTTTLWAVRRHEDHSVVAWAPSYEEACDLAYVLTEAHGSAHIESDPGQVYVDGDEDGSGGTAFVEVEQEVS